ncbi:MAG: response regulator [Negativicutes bacterium]|nr:response regulator [Negativicutes bacterium]
MKTLLFVDDEPRILQGLQRQLHPMRLEWDMTFVASGDQALDFLALHPADIVVSDMMMPGMDGSQLLTEVARRHPQSVRIILSGQAEREAVLRLVGPAHQYLSKPCDADELRRAITQAFALRDLLGNERLKQLTTRIGNLPTLPSLHKRLTEELRKDSPSMERIGQIISHDLGMTAKILQLVNSAFFGLGQPINNPTEAAVYLGLATLRSLVLSVGIFAQYGQESCPHFSLEVLARHSWETAVIARSISQMQQQETKLVDHCFLAGLLHDVGQLILAFGLQDEYTQVSAKAKRDSVPIWQVEQEFFGATHADVGAYLLALWGLSNPVIEAVAQHHHPDRCAGSDFSPVVAVHVADVFAHQFSVTETEAPPPQLNTSHLTRIGLGGRTEVWRDKCRQNIDHEARLKTQEL